MAGKLKKLTNKEKLFVQEYLVDLDVERAATTAGFSKTMSHTKAYSWVCNGKTKPHVFAAIQKRQAKLSEKLQITTESVLKDIRRIGDKAEEADKYGDALKSRELLGKHLKLFTDKVEIGFDEVALNAILGALPPESAEAVKKALMGMSGKK